MTNNRKTLTDRINTFITLSGDDDKLFARYGYKLIQIFETEFNNSNNIEHDLQIKPNFTTRFQEIYVSGLIDQYAPNAYIPWVIDDKYDKNNIWYYCSEYGDKFKNPWFYSSKYPGLKGRGIYV